MQKRISILSILIMALTTMPFSAFARDCADIVTFAASQKWSFGHAVDDAFRDMAKPEEIKVEDDITTYKTYANDVYKQILKEANEQSKKELDEIIPDNADGFIECNGYRADYPNCRGKTLQQCSPKTYEACLAMDYRSNKLDAKEKAEEKYKQALVNKICNGSSALSAEENKAIETEKYIKANGTMPPATSTKPAPAKPTSAKAGGAGAGPKKVVKPTQPATTAVVAPYAATNATVANPAYEDAPRPAHENIEKLTAPVNAPAAVKASDVNIVAKLPCEQEIRKYPHATGISGTTPNCVITDCENDYKVSRDKKSCEEMVNADYPDDYACEILENGQYDAANNNCECPESNEGWDAVHKICSASATRKTFDSSTQTTEPEQKTKKQLKQEAKDKKAQEKSAQKGCSGTGGNWENNTCKCPANNIWNASLQQCVVSRDAKIEACKKYGTWNDDMGTCNCKDSLVWSESSLKCVASDKLDIKDLSESQCNNREGATWDPTQGVCVSLNDKGCTDGDKNCNKTVSKLEKSMEKDIGVLTKAFLSVVKSIVKKCEKDNGNFKDGECVIAQQNPEATETDDNNSNKNKRSKGGKRK